jgi:putative MATE family efflux protein
MISRFLGAGKHKRACLTFSNMVSLVLGLALIFVLLGRLLEVPILRLFGANGDILEPSQVYFRLILMGVPALAWAMMSNNVMRAEGRPRMAMTSMLVPAIANMVLDAVFIMGLGWGLEGAGIATALSYVMSALFTIWFFIWGGSELVVFRSGLKPRWSIVKEIVSIGGVTLARQGSVSLLTIVLNQSLFAYGNELAVAVYGIINRIMMFANFPVLGITQGFLPMAGYNYGAKKWARLKNIVNLSVRSGTLIAVGLFALIMIFSKDLVSLFTTDPKLLGDTPRALRIVFFLTPLIAMQLLGAAYFQAIGKALPALLLTLTKQGFFLIPLVLILPLFMGLDGIWFSFPLADFLAFSVTWYFMQREIKRNIDPRIEQAEKEKVLEPVG